MVIPELTIEISNNNEQQVSHISNIPINTLNILQLISNYVIVGNIQ